MGKLKTGAATRERILQAALELAGREGLESLTTRKVAAEAGITLGLLHYYFDSKEALVEEILSLYFREMGAVLAKSGEGGAGGDAEEQLTELFASTLEVVMSRPGLLFGLVSRIVDTIKETMRKGVGPTHPIDERTLTPFGPLAEIQGLILRRIKPLLASRLGSDDALVARRALQLFTSILHPILATPFPSGIFGCDLGTAGARRDYVRAVVQDALSPRSPPPRSPPLR